MSKQAVLSKTRQTIDTTNDSVIIVEHIADLPGGRTLDVTGFPDDEISAGHVVIKDEEGVYKPLPTDGNVPASHTVEGVTVASCKKDNAQVSVMYNGTVNEAYAKYPYSDAVKKKLSLIKFINE